MSVIRRLRSSAGPFFRSPVLRQEFIEHADRTVATFSARAFTRGRHIAVGLAWPSFAL